MGILRRLGTILGFLKDDPHGGGGGGGGGEEEEDDRTADSMPRRPTRGFSVQVPVAVDKPANIGPILIPCNLGEGGVQGFRWYGRRLRIDEDGDVADEFLDEVLPPAQSGLHAQRAAPRFEVKYNTRPAPVRKQAMAVNGNVHPSMEYKGMLRWV